MTSREDKATLRRVLDDHPPVLADARRVLGNYERRLVAILRAVRDGKLAKAVARLSPQDLAELSGLVEREHVQIGHLLADGVERAYVYGRVLSLATTEAERAAVRAMSVAELMDAVEEVRLTPDERASVEWARYHAGELARGLGNVVNADMRTVAIEADRALRGRYVAEIAEGVAAGLTRRDAWRQMASALGHKTTDWARDMRRVAATEKQAAVEEGVADGIQQRSGAEAGVAKVPEPGACFPVGTLVTTRRGPRAIELLREGDVVLTHKMRWRSITKMFRRAYDGPAVRIRSGPTATANHPFLVRTSAGLLWRKAEALQQGDDVVGLAHLLDPNDEPALFSQQPFLLTIPTSGSAGVMPTTSVQLYRDLQCRDSNIDVEASDSLLRNGSPTRQPLAQLLCAVRDTGLRLLSGLRDLAEHFWRARESTGCPSPLGLCPAFGFGHALLLRSMRFRAALQPNPGGEEPGLYWEPADPKGSGDGRNRAGGFGVGADDRVEVEVELPSGHGVKLLAAYRAVNPVSGWLSCEVYNLSVEEDESYFADGFAVHNCPDCRRLFLEDGAPRVFPLSELRANGTNVGVKRANWKPVLGPVHPWCLPEGQQVRTREGSVPIERVSVGDHVMTHLGRFRRVGGTSSRRYKGPIVVLCLSGLLRDRLELTPEHEVRTKTRWLPAAEVPLGASLLRPGTSTFNLVELVSRYRYEGLVHNLSVEEDESYVAQGVAVHNCACSVIEVPEGYQVTEAGTLERLERSLTLPRDLAKAVQGVPPPTLTYGDSVPVEGVVVRVGDPKMREAVEEVVADTPAKVFHRDVAVTLITTDAPRPGNPLEEHDLAYWTGNEIRIMQTLPVGRVDYCLRHEIGHAMNVWLLGRLGGVPAVRAWHDDLWAVSEEEGWVSDYARREPIENAAEVSRMYLYERGKLMLRHPRQFAHVHRAYRPIWRRPAVSS